MGRRALGARRPTPLCTARMTRLMGWDSILTAVVRSPYGQESWLPTLEPSIEPLTRERHIWRGINTDWRSFGFFYTPRVQTTIDEMFRTRRRKHGLYIQERSIVNCKIC
jgi:hypothetical protein